MKRQITILEVKQMKDFENAYKLNKSREMTQKEAADLLGISERQFRRKKCLYEENNNDYICLLDRRRCKAPANKISLQDTEEIERLYKERYYDFNAKHFHEKLTKIHKKQVSYSWTKKLLQSKKLMDTGKKKATHRKRRERKPMSGMMIHQDASTHDWFGLGYKLDLVVTLDDANNEIYSIFLTEQEGTLSSFRGLYETFSKKGLANSFYTDRGSHYKTTREKNSKEKYEDTQVERALKQLSIRFIHANSPQARGRSERMFGTLQNRLPQEFRIRKIKDMKKANDFLKDEFMDEFNRIFMKDPEKAETAFVDNGNKDLLEILSIQHKRIVKNDNTISYERRTIQLEEDGMRHHYVKCEVTVHEYYDGSIGVFYGPRKLKHSIKNNTNKELDKEMGASPQTPRVLGQKV